MNEGYTLTDHEEYHKMIKPYMDKYGLTLHQNYAVSKKLSGTAADNVIKIGVWNLESIEGMQKIMGDKDYQNNAVEKRNKIHDMPNLTIFIGRPLFEKSFEKSKLIISDFIVMNDGYGAKERDDYFSKLEKNGKKYGLKRFAAYEVTKFMGGKGPKTTSLVNFWEAGPETIQKLMGDPEYQKNMVPIRNKIFNMSEVSVFFAKPMDEQMPHCEAK
jgi:hypothetical protein